MAPNLTEEQTLIKYFKYFDLDNSGLCTIRDWIKAVEKIGVIIQKSNDLQTVFKNYDKLNKGIINYKEFAKNLFEKKQSNNSGSNQGRQNNKE